MEIKAIDAVLLVVLFFVFIAIAISVSNAASLADGETAATCEEKRIATPIRKTQIRLRDYTEGGVDGVAVVEIEGHDYVIATRTSAISICHAASCNCIEKKGGAK